MHPDGTEVAVGMADGSIRVWSIEGEPGPLMRGHSNAVSAVRYSPNGTRLASAGDDGIVRVWDAATGRPHWRAPLLIDDPPRLLSHRGWVPIDDGTPAPEAAWDTAAQRSRFGELDRIRRRLCLTTHDDRVELWDVAADEKVRTHHLPELAAARAVDGGCVVRSSSGVHRVAPDGSLSRLLARPAEAIGVGDDTVLVADQETIWVMSTDGERRGSYEAGVGVAAVVRAGDQIVIGYRDGSLAERRVSADAPTAALHFDSAPAGPVTRLLPGPPGTIVAGYADGTVGMWSLADGTNLARARLHGAVAHLVRDGDRLIAASELGRFVTWDLSLFVLDYCQILREVWREVPVTWAHGRVVATPPPRDHPCAESVR